MSLSKIYKSSDTFQPSDIVQETLTEQHFRGQIAQPAEQAAPFKTSEQAFQGKKEDSPPRQEPQAAPEKDVGPEPANNAQPAAEKKRARREDPGIPTAEVERIASEAHKQGIHEGMKKAEEDFGSAIRSMLTACSQIDGLREMILKNSIGEMQELVIAIAEKIIRHSVMEQKETILLTVEEAIGKAVKSEQLSIFVNPDDYDTIASKSEEFMTNISGLSNILVKKDATIEIGGCKIESENCTVDASMVSQMEIVHDQVKKQE